ncbi:MAG: hypothetical protein ABIT58_10450 [Ferruginibacter sp.]
MKRKNIIPSTFLICILFSGVVSNAQSRKGMVTPFRKGTVTFNAGVGFGTDYKNEYASSSALGTKAAFEFGVFPAGPGVISLGVEVGATTSNKSNRYYKDDFRSHTLVVAGRSAWHFGWKIPGLDTYAGLSAGAGFHHYEYYDSPRDKYKQDDLIPVVGGFAGVSYFFTPKFGVNAEAGFDITSIQAGVIFKLK